MGHLKECTDSNHAADQPCSSGTSVAACTEVLSVLETSTEQVGHSFTLLAGRCQLGLKMVY